MLFRRKPTLEAAWERAEALLNAQKTADAETVMAQALTEVEKKEGVQSANYFSGIEYLATCQMAGGITGRAIATLQRGCAQPQPADSAAQKSYLTLFMNLGELLRMTGELEDAENVLRKGLTGRERFYGKQHAGYAFGLEPLADVLLAQGKIEDALPLYAESMKIFSQGNHPRVFGAMVHHAFAQKLQTPEQATFERINANKDGWNEIGQAALVFAQNLMPDQAAPALWDLQKALAEQLSESHPLRENCLALVANKEYESETEGHFARQQKALMLLTNLYHAKGEKNQMLQAMQGVAFSQSAAGEDDAAQATYRRVVGLAQKLDDPTPLSRTLRNQGLHLAEMARRDEAEVILRRALLVADVPLARQEKARAQVALGIFLQHGGDLTEAEPLLEAAIRSLPPDDPDTFPARNHLNAIRKNQSCGCGDSPIAFSEGFQAFLDTQLPSEWRGQVNASFNEDGELTIEVDIPVKKEEAQRLGLIVNHALAKYQSSLTAPR